MQFAPLNMSAIQGTGLASFIDHTLLRPDAKEDDIRKICDEAIRFGFAGVCVHSQFVPLISSILEGKTPKAVSVVGFPHGANLPAAVAKEAKLAVRAGASEIDMVIPLGFLKAGNDIHVKETIRGVVSESLNVSEKALVKVIIETALLDENEKRRACELSAAAGAHFVKTCTGFSGGAAEEADIRLMKSTVGNDIGVKASGGVRTHEKAMALLLAGAHRLGTSSGVALVEKTAISGGY